MADAGAGQDAPGEGATNGRSHQRVGTGHVGEPPVVRLANDIARQFAHLPPDDGARAVAAHLTTFWDPRMRAQLTDEIARDPDRLDPLVLAAVGAGTT